MSPASSGLPNSSASPSLGGEQAGQHFHGRGLAAAVRAEKAEDLAALDGEVHPVDRREIAETTGEVAGDDDGLGVDGPTRRYLQLDDDRRALAFRQATR